MTLREEIKAICKGLNYEVTMQSCDEETDEILKLFEKLIDKLDKAAEREYDVDYWAALRDIRQELKK